MAKNNTRGFGCMALFALPFMAVGVFMGVLATRMIFDSAEMSDWPVVEATIVESNLEISDSDDSTTRRATATYTYSVDGVAYSGTRVGLASGTDNIGSWHVDAHQRIQAAFTAGHTIDVHVDPADSSRAVLFPELRLELLFFYLIFVIVFGGVGFGIFFYAIFWARKQSRLKSRQAEQPGSPWHWKPEWEAGRIEHSPKRVFWIALGVALFWNAISTPVIFAVPGELAKGNTAILFGLLFPLIGLVLLFWAFVAFLAWRKFGTTTFEMPRVPGVIGGRLGGIIMTSRDLEPLDGIHLNLACIRRHVVNSSNSRTVKEDRLWESKQVLDREILEDDPTKSAIPVVFDIPFDAQETTLENENDRIVWRLTASTREAGIDFKAEFDVPVFKTEESSPTGSTEPDPAAAFRRPDDSDAPAAVSRIKITPDLSGGGEFYYPPARNPGSCMAVTVFAMIWSSVLYLMWANDAPLPFILIFGLIDVLILYAVVAMWTETWRIAIDRDQVTIRHSILGLPRTRTIPTASVKAFAHEDGMKSGQQVYIDIHARTHDGKKHKAGSSLPTREEALWLIERMNRALAAQLR